MRDELAAAIKWVHSKGWAPATGGNFSVVVNEDPLRLLMSPSGFDKGSVSSHDLIVIDEHLNVLEGSNRPSAEAELHVSIAQHFGAKAILHGHSVSNTLLSLSADTVILEGYEMLKALANVTTHEHRELVPVFENSQNMAPISDQIRQLDQRTHAFLLRGHGLYTWGDSLNDAKRQMEALEFLFEIESRKTRYGTA